MVLCMYVCIFTTHEELGASRLNAMVNARGRASRKNSTSYGIVFLCAGGLVFAVPPWGRSFVCCDNATRDLCLEKTVRLYLSVVICSWLWNWDEA